MILAFLSAALLQASPAEARIDRLEQVYRDSGNAALIWLIAEARAEAGDTAGALKALAAIRDRGLGFEVTANSPLRKLAGDPRFDHLAWQLERSARIDGGARPAAVIDAQGVIAEGIAADPQSGRWFVGDMAERRIFVRQPDGSWKIFATSGSLRPIGMKVDPLGRRLWVAATTAFVAGDAPESALLAFELDSGALVRSVTGPDVKSLNDLAILPDGAILVTDSSGGAVHRLPPGGDRLEKIDGEPMAYPNSGSRGRILRLRLAPDGSSIVGHEVLESAHPSFDIPTTGTIAGSRFLFIANSQLDRLQDDGRIKGPVKPVLIMELPLGGR